MDFDGSDWRELDAEATRSDGGVGCACLGLIPLDSAVIRRRAVTACKRAATYFRKAETELTHFETADRPAFERWSRLTQGPKLEALRELRQRLLAAHLLLGDLEEELEASGDPLHIVFSRVSRRCADDEADSPDSETEHAGAAGSASAAFEWEADAPLGAELDREEPDLDEGSGVGARDSERVYSRSERCRLLYRELARALHPDQGARSEEQMRVWYAVQEAYRLSDLDRLEILATHTDVIGGHVTAATSISRLMELAESFRRARIALRRVIRDCRHEPAWGFLTLNGEERARREWAMSGQLQYECDVLRARLTMMEALVEEWKVAPPPPSRHRSRRSRESGEQMFLDLA